MFSIVSLLITEREVLFMFASPLKPSNTLNRQAAAHFIEHSLPDLTPGIHNRCIQQFLKFFFDLLVFQMIS